MPVSNMAHGASPMDHVNAEAARAAPEHRKTASQMSDAFTAAWSSSQPSRELASLRNLFAREPTAFDDVREHVSFVNPFIFNVVIMFAILANTIQLGWCASKAENDTLCAAAEGAFAAIFGIEMILKIHAQGLLYFRFAWNILDCLLVWLAIADTVFLMGDVSCEVCEDMMLMRLLKLLRTLRVFRILKAKQELVILVEGLFASLGAMVWVAVLLLILVYAGGIFCVGAFSRDDKEEFGWEVAYFDTLGASMMTLFSVAILDMWDEVVRPLGRAYPLSVVFFICYIFVSCFGILNLLIGIITERAHKATQDFQHRKTLEMQQEKLERINESADEMFINGWKLSPNDMDQVSPEILGKLLAEIDPPEGFTIADLHLMCSPDLKLSKEDFIQAMRRFVCCSDFERDCLFQHSMNDIRRRLTKVEDNIKGILKLLQHGASDPSVGGNEASDRSPPTNRPKDKNPAETEQFNFLSPDVRVSAVPTQGMTSHGSFELSASNATVEALGDEHLANRENKVAACVPDTCEAAPLGPKLKETKEIAEPFSGRMGEANQLDSFLLLEYRLKAEIWKIKELCHRSCASQELRLAEAAAALANEKNLNMEYEIKAEIWQMKECLKVELQTLWEDALTHEKSTGDKRISALSRCLQEPSRPEQDMSRLEDAIPYKNRARIACVDQRAPPLKRSQNPQPSEQANANLTTSDLTGKHPTPTPLVKIFQS